VLVLRQIGKVPEEFQKLFLEVILRDEEIFVRGESLNEAGIPCEKNPPLVSRLLDQFLIGDLPKIKDIKPGHPKPSGQLPQHFIGDEDHSLSISYEAVDEIGAFVYNVAKKRERDKEVLWSKERKKQEEAEHQIR